MHRRPRDRVYVKEDNTIPHLFHKGYGVVFKLEKLSHLSSRFFGLDSLVLLLRASTQFIKDGPRVNVNKNDYRSRTSDFSKGMK